MTTAPFKGWLLDLYLNQQNGINLWFISETDDRRVCFSQPFPVTFYASGDHSELRRLWKQLKSYEGVTSLYRIQKQDVFVAEPVDVLAVDVDGPARQQRVFREIEQSYPTLAWYDSDISIQARYMARYGVFPMALCEIEADENSIIQHITPLNSRWDVLPEMPPLRQLRLSPDVDPARAKVRSIRVETDWFNQELVFDINGLWLRAFNEILDIHDPDLLITDWGDTWMLPFLLKQAETYQLPLRLNRDPLRVVRWQKANSYYSYGHIVYRAEEAHLFGRCHLDRKTAMMWSDYNLAGTLEMARVTTLPIEKAGRVSPGQGISTMQVITALEKDVLVPYQKRQVEAFKSGMQLIQSDRGGMIYQPKVGLHTEVAEIDFVSMYPAVIIKGNISPEVPLPEMLEPSSHDLGVVPLTLKPLYLKRIALKQKTREYPPDHPLVKSLKARSSALKWLLVVCFGFLGYKNARYGRIEAHEAVTKGGREVLLRAKEVAESEGFEVLHMYVDALWIKKKGYNRPEHFMEVINKINLRTGLTINLDGIMRWVAFLPSKTDERVPIPNRYFGVFQSGEVKIRGLDARRRDTPIWISAVQQHMIDLIGQAINRHDLKESVREAFAYYLKANERLKSDELPYNELIINGKVSFALDAYKTTTPSVRAAKQMEAAGIPVRPGQRIRFLYTLGDPDVFAWDVGACFDPKLLNRSKYVELLAKAAASVLMPFGIDSKRLQEWVVSGKIQLILPV